MSGYKTANNKTANLQDTEHKKAKNKMEIVRIYLLSDFI